HYLMRLNADPKKNLEAWQLLNTGYTRLPGYTVLGEKKERAEILARVNDAQKGPPLLARMDVGANGRVLAFGASETYRWTQPSEAQNDRLATFKLHTRFWKQTVLWLAHQDEVEGNVYVRPEYRRLVVNGQQTVRMGLRDKRGDDVPEADLKYQILGPG